MTMKNLVMLLCCVVFLSISRNASAQRTATALGSHSVQSACSDSSGHIFIHEDTMGLQLEIYGALAPTSDGNLLVPIAQYSYRVGQFLLPYLLKCTPNG